MIKSSWLSSSTALALLAFTLGGGGGGVAIYYAAKTPPTTLVSLHEADGVAVRGGTIDLIATIHRTEDCETTVERWLFRPDPMNPVRVQWRPLPGAPTPPPSPIGRDTEYRLSIPVPAEAETGDWSYEGIAHDHCPLVSSVASPTRASLPFLIHIVQPTAADPAAVSVPPGAIELFPDK